MFSWRVGRLPPKQAQGRPSSARARIENHVSDWRRSRAFGGLEGLGRPRGPRPAHPLVAENERVSEEVGHVEARLSRTEKVIVVGGKVSGLLLELAATRSPGGGSDRVTELASIVGTCAALAYHGRPTTAGTGVRGSARPVVPTARSCAKPPMRALNVSRPLGSGPKGASLGPGRWPITRRLPGQTSGSRDIDCAAIWSTFHHLSTGMRHCICARRCRQTCTCH